jgi:predicted nucleotidyltransferase
MWTCFWFFDDEAKPTLIDIARIETELSGLLGGTKVDLRTAGDLSKYFRDDVLASAELQYATR